MPDKIPPVAEIVSAPQPADALALFRPAVREWFTGRFGRPTRAQTLGWPPIVRGESTLLLAPTGTGKTLAAFLACIDRILFSAQPIPAHRCRVLYVSPLKALAVDVDRNLRGPIAGILELAQRRGKNAYAPEIFVRTGDTPAADRARFQRQPADILVTTPESLYLLLTSRARELLRSLETVIIDEIHALVPNKRGAHLALSLERTQAICSRPLQRIGLSATQRPLEEVALFLGGYQVQAENSNTNAAVVRPRPVTVVDAAEPKPLELRVELPGGDQTASPSQAAGRSGSGQGDGATSVWQAIYPRLLELIGQHRSTLIFVNSRRLARRVTPGRKSINPGIINVGRVRCAAP